MNPLGDVHARFHITYPGFTLNVDLHLPGSGVTVLYGPSGSGKTTCLRAIAGLEQATSSYLSVNGQVWQDDSVGVFVPTYRRSLGYVFQEASLFPHLSMRRNLEFGMRRVPERTRQVSLQHAVELLGIRHLLDRLPEKLSGGEKQRVAIARALVTSPRILLMDEPLAALDIKRKQEILPYLERLHAELEIPVIYVSHVPEEIARLADHVVILEYGQVIASGTMNEILTRLDLPIQLGEDAGTLLAGVVAEVDNQWDLARIEFDGGNIWTRDYGIPAGHSVRVRILARDISIALQPHNDTSIMNILPASVEQLAEDAHPGSMLVRLTTRGVPLIARITRHSAAKLDLQPGQQVWVQIKAVALME